MARIRTIKPEFFTSEQVVECSTSARLLFVGLWCFCDDAGTHPASVKRLKMEVFPGDSIPDSELQSLINELLDNKLLIEFEAENQRFWHVPTWTKHQKIEKPTFRYPHPDATNSTTIRRGVDEESSNTPRPLDPGMESNGMEEREAKDSSLSSRKSKKTENQIPAELQELVEAWNSLPDRIAPRVVKPGSKSIAGGWARVQRYPDAAVAFADIPGLMLAIRQGEFLHAQSWFVFEWLFAKDKDRLTWNVVKVLTGRYAAKPGASLPNGHATRPTIKPVSEVRVNAVGGIMTSGGDA